MKKFNLKLLSIILVLIFATTILASCAKNEGSYAPGYDIDVGESVNKDSIGSTVPSPESGSQGNIDTDRKIIKTVKINAETKDFDKAIENINVLCANIGGYIESSTVSGNSINSGRTSRSAYFTLRIPADKLDEFTGNVEDSVNITNLSSSSTEITESYYDAVARLEVLETQRESLQKMLKEANGVNEMLSIQDRLYDVIEEIESYKARINSYDNKVAYSTVSINLYEVLEYSQINRTELTFGERFVRALKRGVTDFWDGCQDFAVWFAEALPTLILLAALTFAAIVIIKKIRKTKKLKKAQKSEAPTPIEEPKEK